MCFKIAVIGCGWIAQSRHGPAYAQYAALHPEVELAACCDPDRQRAETFRAQYGFQRSYASYLDLLDTERPAAVCLNVPEHLTCEIGCQVMQRGFPLLAEKPPGLNLAEVERLIETANASGVIHQVAFNRRHTPLAVELKRRLTGKTITHLDCQFYRNQRADNDFTTTAIHAVDMARFLAGCDFQQIHFHYREFPEYRTKVGVAHYLLQGAFTNGACASLSICPMTGVTVERMTVHTPDASFVLQMNLGPDAPGRLVYYKDGQLAEAFDAATFCNTTEDFILSGFAGEDFIFLDAVRSGRQPADDFASARQSVAIMEAMRHRRTTFP